jgi:hypothetical protein
MNEGTRKYKVVQIWPGQTVTCLHKISPGRIWTTLYINTKFKSKDRNVWFPIPGMQNSAEAISSRSNAGNKRHHETCVARGKGGIRRIRKIRKSSRIWRTDWQMLKKKLKEIRKIKPRFLGCSARSPVTTDPRAHGSVGALEKIPSETTADRSRDPPTSSAVP